MTCRLPSRLAGTLAVILALGACNAHTPTAPSRDTSLDAALAPLPGTGPETSSIPRRRASPVVVLPAWIGRPTGLREHEDADGFEQAITLGATPRGAAGDTAVLVSVRHPDTASERRSDGVVGRVDKPTRAGILAELEAAFPGLAMQVVTRPAANAYGPYGLAIGRDPAGARCLYAWQWIAEPPALAVGQTASAPMSLRVRLCRTDMTLETMAAAVNQLRIVPRFAGTSITGTSAAEPRIATGRRLAESHRRARRQRVAVDRVASVARRDLAPSALAAPSPPDPSGRRYLGTEARPAAPAMGVMPGALAGLGAGVAAPTSGVIAADLPPEATRGPSGLVAR